MYRIIDKEGYFLRDDFTYDEKTEIALEAEPVSGFFRAKWDFKAQEWTEGEISEGLMKELRKGKKEELSYKCEESILSGFSIEISNEIYHLSYDREAQANLQERWQLFQNNMIETITMTFHKDGESLRLPVDKKEFTQIYLASVKVKEDKISRLRDILYPIVDEALSIEQLNTISWDSEVVLPEEPSVVFDDSNTIEKQINKTNQQVKQTNQKLSMTNSGLLELTLLTMMGGY